MKDDERMYHEILDEATYQLRQRGIPSARIARELGDDDGKRLSAMAHEPAAKSAFDRTCAYIHAMAVHGEVSLIEALLDGTGHQVAPRFDCPVEVGGMDVPGAFVRLSVTAAELMAEVQAALADGRIDRKELIRIAQKGQSVQSAAAGTVESARKEAGDG